VLLVLADRVFAYESFGAAFRDRGRFYAALMAGWGLFAIQAVETPFFREDGFEVQTSRWNYLLNQPPLIVSYLRLSVWPTSLVFDYGLTRELTLSDVWFPALFVLALFALTVTALIRVPRVGFWGAWFYVTLAPASSFIPIPTEAGAERRMYLPLVAVIVLAGLSARWLALHASALLDRRGMTFLNGTAPRRVVFSVALGVVVLLLAFATVRRNREYQTGLSIWQSVIDRHPHPRAHSNLAVQLRDAGRDAEAIEHLRRAAPDWPDAKLPLGSALRERGEMTEAIAMLRDFIRLRPRSPQILAARMELASALTATGDVRAAAAELESIVASAPDSAGARHALGDLYFSSGDFTRAAAEYRQYLQLQPKNELVHIRLGLALAASGDRSAAIESYRQALAIQPRSAAARRGLLDALQQERRFAELEMEARATLEFDDTDWSIHNMLGIALASQRRFDEAAAAFAEAVRLNPASSEAQGNLRQAMALRQRAGAGAP
jgi:Flp pilus assembly protein TadD